MKKLYCPFCGCDDENKFEYDEQLLSIVCCECLASGPPSSNEENAMMLFLKRSVKKSDIVEKWVGRGGFHSLPYE